MDDMNGACFGVPGIGRAFHPWDDLEKCSCGGYPYMVGLDGKDFDSGSPYKIFCTRCLKSTVANEDISTIKKEWNQLRLNGGGKTVDNSRYLFRGKRNDNGNWVVGNYCYSPDFPITIFGEDELGRHGIKVDHSTIGQYTGKSDISGEEVFEGDIIVSHLGGQVHALNMLVKFGTYQAYCPADKCYMDSVGFYVSAQGYPDMPIGPLEDYAKVIGNIYDNPELISN